VDNTHINGLLDGLGTPLWSHRQLGALHGEEVLLLLLARQRGVDPRHLQLGLGRRRLLLLVAVGGGLVVQLLLVQGHQPRRARLLLLRPPQLPAGALLSGSDQHHGVNRKTVVGKGFSSDCCAATTGTIGVGCDESKGRGTGKSHTHTKVILVLHQVQNSELPAWENIPLEMNILL
jgi:hypothetical protein